jgi:hypothetical protein
MKIKAFRVNCCGLIVDEDSCTGLICNNTIFGVEYKTVNPEKSDCHFCVNCYNNIVVVVDRIVDKRKNQKLWREKYEEYMLSFKKNVYYNFITAKK